MLLFLLITYVKTTTLIAGYNDLRDRLQQSKYFIAASLIIHSGKNCPLCIQAEQVLDQLELEMEGAIKIYKLDCALPMPDLNIYGHCNSENFSKMPDIRFFIPKIDLTLPFHPLDDIRFEPEEHTYLGPLNVQYLSEYAGRLQIFFGQVIEEESKYKKFSSSWPLKVKAAYFDDFTQASQCPAFFKFLSSFFHVDIEVIFNFINYHQFAYVHRDINKQQEGNLILTTKNNYSKVILSIQKSYGEAKQLIINFLKETGIFEELYEIYDNPLQDHEIQLREIDNIRQNLEQWRIVYMGFDNSEANRTFYMIKNAFKDLCIYYRIQDPIKPQILVFPFGSNNSVSIKNNIKLIAKHFLLLMGNSTDVKDNELKQSILSTLKNGKFPIVWFYDTKDLIQQIVMRTFAGFLRYKKICKFFFYGDPDQNRREAWNITELPKIYTIFELNAETNAHNKWAFQYSFNMRNLHRYFTQIEETKFSGIFMKLNFSQARNQKEFNSKCFEEPCVIGLFNIKKQGKLKIHLNLMNEVMDRFRGLHFNWLWIDRNCFKNSTAELMIYLPTNQKATFLEDELNEISVRQFIEDSLTGKLSWIQLEKIKLSCEIQSKQDL